MKKLLFGLLVLAAIVLLPSIALAADNITVKVTPDPAKLSKGGTVNLKIVATNNSTKHEGSEVIVTIAGKTYELGTISTGLSKEYSGEVKYDIAVADIGKSVSVACDYQMNGSKQSTSTTFKVTLDTSADNMKVNGSATPEKSSANVDDKVVITFEIENLSNFDLEKVQITAPALNSGKAVNTAATIKAGAKRTFEYTATIKKEIKVEAVAKFTVAGSTASFKFDPFEIKLATPGLDVIISAEEINIPTGSEAPVKISIANNGNVAFSGIIVEDNNGKTVKPPKTSVAVGAKIEYTANVEVSESGEYSLKVTAKDPNDKMYVFESNEIAFTAIEPDPDTPVEPAKGVLSLTTVPSANSITEAGEMNFTFTLENTSEETLSSIIISEQGLGEIYKLATLAPGKKEITKSLKISATTEFVFTVSGIDTEGNALTSDPDNVEVILEAPEAPEAPNLLPFIIIGIVVLAAGGAIAFFLTTRNKKLKFDREASLDEDHDEYGYPKAGNRRVYTQSDMENGYTPGRQRNIIDNRYADDETEGYDYRSAPPNRYEPSYDNYGENLGRNSRRYHSGFDHQAEDNFFDREKPGYGDNDGYSDEPQGFGRTNAADRRAERAARFDARQNDIRIESRRDEYSEPQRRTPNVRNYGDEYDRNNF